MNAQTKKKILPCLPYVILFWCFEKLAELYRLSPSRDAVTKCMDAIGGFGGIFSDPLPSLHPRDLLIGLLGAAAVRLAIYVKSKNAKKFRKGVEYGSARWGNHADIQPYLDEKPENNVILTQTEGLTMNSRPKNPKYARNKNVLVIGGSGSGKSRFFVKPNMMQCHSSYVLTDPKGELLLSCGKMLEKNGYQIKVFNTINLKRSMHYNPFSYVHSEQDILKLVTTLMANTKEEGEKSSDDFWTKAEKLGRP